MYPHMKTKPSTFFLSPTIIVGAFFLLLFNIIVLDYLVLRANTSSVLGDTTASACPSACLSAINSLSGSSVGTSTGAKEFSVELGTGTNATDDWADVPGAQAYVNTNWYTRIKK